MSISRSFHLSDSKLWQISHHHLLPQGCEGPFVLQGEKGRSNEGRNSSKVSQQMGS